MKTTKYLRVTFGKDAVYDIPVSEVIRHYARFVLQQIAKIDFETALKEAEKYFAEDQERLIEHATHGMTWIDVVVDAITINKGSFINRDKEWIHSKKELIER